MSRPFGGFTFWQTFNFREKKSVISYVALCVLCMQVLQGDLKVIQDAFQLFSIFHCSQCPREYKSVLFFYLITQQNRFLVILSSSFLS